MVQNALFFDTQTRKHANTRDEIRCSITQFVRVLQGRIASKETSILLDEVHKLGRYSRQYLNKSRSPDVASGLEDTNVSDSQRPPSGRRTSHISPAGNDLQANQV